MAGRIPKQFIDDLLMRVDIIDVIDVRVPLKKAGKDHKACCPFHDEKTPSFTVSQSKQFYHCFGCGAHGTAIGFLMEHEHMSFLEAVKELAGRVGLALPNEVMGPDVRNDAGPDLLSVLSDAAHYYRSQLRDNPQAEKAIAYLKSRGITGEIAAAFGLGYAPEGWDNLSRALAKNVTDRETLVRAGLAVKKDGGGTYDRFRHRILFPIHDYRGRIVGFGGRIIDKGEPKYLNSPETPLFHKGRELYGLFRAREAIRNQNQVLVVEGYMDVVALAQFEIDFAVATLGTATTRDHLERLFRFVPEVVFCFDGDRAGREAARRALEIALPTLHEGRQVSYLFLPEGEDPDTLVRKEGREAFLKRLSAAVPLPDFLFQLLATQADLRRIDGRARLVELARPLLSNLPAGVFQEMMLARLAETTGIATNQLGNISTLSAHSKPKREIKRAAGAPKRPPSLVRIAIALLVQHPPLAIHFESYSTRDLDLPGMDLLNAVAKVLQERPGLNTAALIEHYRETEHANVLARLAVWEHPTLAQDDVAAEFIGVLSQLNKAAAKADADRLLQKQRLQGLTVREKAELARLLAGKTGVETGQTH